MNSATRHLPHRYALEQPLFVTFRLSGSLPAGREFPPECMTSGAAFVTMDRLLDTGRFGPIHLWRSEIAQIVRYSILHCAGVNYELHAWVIMPNHVHILLTPHTDVSEFLRRLKGFSARRSNRLLNQPGQRFWQEESYDLVRSGQEFRNITTYILNNPVRAGLVNEIEAFPWSSAAHHA